MTNLGMTLFGGSYSVSIAVLPQDDGMSVREATERMDKACDQAPKAVTCTIVGPAKLKLQTGKATAEAAAMAGETARVVLDLRKNRLNCEDL